MIRSRPRAAKGAGSRPSAAVRLAGVRPLLTDRVRGRRPAQPDTVLSTCEPEPPDADGMLL